MRFARSAIACNTYLRRATATAHEAYSVSPCKCNFICWNGFSFFKSIYCCCSRVGHVFYACHKLIGFWGSGEALYMYVRGAESRNTAARQGVIKLETITETTHVFMFRCSRLLFFHNLISVCYYRTITDYSHSSVGHD